MDGGTLVLIPPLSEFTRKLSGGGDGGGGGGDKVKKPFRRG